MIHFALCHKKNFFLDIKERLPSIHNGIIYFILFAAYFIVNEARIIVARIGRGRRFMFILDGKCRFSRSQSHDCLESISSKGVF